MRGTAVRSGRTLIEDWFPIEMIGCESLRDSSAAQKPPLNRLHVWWARRPLTASRAAMLASVLPSWNDAVARLGRKRGLFRSEEEYREWFVKLCGIYGDPVAGRKKILWAKERGIRLKDPPYSHKRAFTVNPTPEQRETLQELLRYTWGRERLALLDPFAGGGSIPFETVRYGFETGANELNPVAGIILIGTLDYPFHFGPALAKDLRKWGAQLVNRLRERLAPFFPEEASGRVHAYIWARTVLCPYTGKPIPLAPNWWLSRSDSTGIAVRPVFDADSDMARFEIVDVVDGTADDGFDPTNGTVRPRDAARSPWANDQSVG